MTAKNIIRQSIIDLIRAKPGISQMDIAEELKLDKSTVNRHVKAIRAEWGKADE